MSAADRTRTCTSVRTLAPEASVSANSTTAACEDYCELIVNTDTDLPVKALWRISPLRFPSCFYLDL